MRNRIFSTILATCILFSVIITGTMSTQAREINNSSVSATQTEVSTGSNSYGLVDNVQNGQILQCFNWSYQNIKNSMKKIAEQGFSAVQTSPIQTIKESTQNKSQKGSWWVYYQPTNFSIDTSSQNALGTKNDFREMCNEAHKYGVKVIVDAVLNHLANKYGNDLSDTIPGDIRNDGNCWHSITQNTSNWNDRYDITHNCMDGLPDLNTGNPKIQNYAISFLKEAIEAGADGFRFDGAKHIETPGDSYGVSSDFWPNVLNAATSYAKSTRNITPYYYGEILDSTGGVSINAYTQYMSITDNNTADNIRGAVNGGNASGAATGYLSKGAAANKTVLWNESHDTYQNGNSSGVSQTNINKTWAVVGSRNEVCGMYLARPSNFGSQRIGESSTGTGWDSTEVKAINQFKNYFAGQSEYISSSGSIAYNERGTTGVILTNCSGGSVSVNVFAHKMANGTYKDVISGNTFTVSGGNISGQIGSTGIAVVYNQKPVESVSITPGKEDGNTNYKTDTYTLTLNATNVKNAQYCIDNGSYNTFTDGKTISIGAGVSYGTVTKVTVKADNVGPYTYSYTKVDPTLTQKVYFDNSSYNWSSVYAYIYKDETTNNGAWPGTKMSIDSSTGYFVVEIPENFSNGYIIFTEDTNATNNRYPADMEPGLSLDGTTKLFSSNHKFEEYTPTVPTQQPTQKPTQQPTQKPTTQEPTEAPSPTVTSTQKVYFDNTSYNWSSVNAYIYNDNVTNNGAWPGTKMSVDSSTGYYVIEIPKTFSNGYIIFTENSNATNNRYPADMQPGMPLEGKTKIFRANHSFEDYTPPQPQTQTPTSITTYVLVGDVNQDGVINIMDSIVLQRHIIGVKYASEFNKVAADCNRDSSVSVGDVTCIQKYIAGLIDKNNYCGKKIKQ